MSSSKMEVDEKESREDQKGDPENNEQKRATVDWSDFDVSEYASRYKGKVKVDRLLHIAQVNEPVAVRAFELAVDEARKGIDIQLYDRVCDFGQKLLGENKVLIDAAWMGSMSQENEQKARHLEDEIQRWRNLSNREKVCNAYIDAGKFYAQIGSYSTAISRLIEGKSYAPDARILLDINLRIITHSIQSGSLTHVRSEAAHALSSQEAYTDAKARSKAQAALGLTLLRQGRYETAINHFVDCDYSLHGQWPEALSGHDIALYGGLCALASLSRASLKKKVLDNEHFKRFLELRPTVSKLVRGFYDNEYGIVMSGLNALKKELIVDIHLYSGVEALLSAIRGKALVQYFSPYSAMDMKKMAKAFNVSLPEMEQELSTCVSDGHIQAKIDSHSKIVYASLQNKRNKLFDDVLQLGDEFATEMRGVLLRMSLQENGVIVSQTREMLQEMEMMGDSEDPKNGLVGAMAGMGRRVLGFGPSAGGPSGRGGGGGGKQPRRG